MSEQPKVIVLRTAGTNCDAETAFAFAHFGARTDLVHMEELHQRQAHLKDYHILALPGGFTYGDDIESGRILANELRFHLGEALCEFI
ncbi:MAG: phosphoribosylformylglycinamidine synthase subunit PurQ, partial [Candidatus Omnitrophica bacterium]|nr:phosphoribosylformylglycinamidine synthase subunit PurQ [Candidatus Omnitrophota bacterium]